MPSSPPISYHVTIHPAHFHIPLRFPFPSPDHVVLLARQFLAGSHLASFENDTSQKSHATPHGRISAHTSAVTIQDFTDRYRGSIAPSRCMSPVFQKDSIGKPMYLLKATCSKTYGSTTCSTNSHTAGTTVQVLGNRSNPIQRRPRYPKVDQTGARANGQPISSSPSTRSNRCTVPSTTNQSSEI